jgi:transcriptional regulator with XRE-family HTH domain
MSNLIRKSHFLGSKIRNLRKRNGLTLQDISSRCIQIDADIAPSVSYLSMIETGKRIPSEEVLELFTAVFQKSRNWFLDENTEVQAPAPITGSGGIERIPLEPAFLFSKDLLGAAIPELLSQTGTTGRQFAHLLIRSYQETRRNEFPDLERSAEEVGERRFPMSVDHLVKLYKKHGLEIHWFKQKPIMAKAKDEKIKTFIRSFFEAPNRVYINQRLQADSAPLKYDMAIHLGHKVLHGGDGMISAHATGGPIGGIPENTAHAFGGMDSHDILHAWRDFECSFFAGALLCPKRPFRRFLMRESYNLAAGEKLDLTPAVIMRRMTAVSPYRHWHYFDAYPPGYLRAVYRGNGIPLPWGNMNMVTDPCPKWAVFYMLHKSRAKRPSSQISILRDGDRALLYCCHSLRINDQAGNPHVLSVGIDLVPALQSQGTDTDELVARVAEACLAGGGQAMAPRSAAHQINAAGRVLNIAWVADALESPASMICPRSSACPRPDPCERLPKITQAMDISELRRQIISQGS